MKKTNNKKYSEEYKLEVVKDYYRNRLGVRTTALYDAGTADCVKTGKSGCPCAKTSEPSETTEKALIFIGFMPHMLAGYRSCQFDQSKCLIYAINA